MKLADLPSRRVEAWKWSDLRAALAGDEARLPEQAPPAGASPIEALARLAGEAGSLRQLVVKAGENLALVDRVSSQAGVVAHASVSDIVVEPGGSLTRIVVQGAEAEDRTSVILDETRVKLGAGATFRQFIIADGARLARFDTHVTVAGEGATTELNGVYLAAAKRHVDLTSQVIHDALRPETRQLVRGVARKGGRGVFQGKFKVERTAQKTDAQMQHNALLFEDGAEVFAKPELEIYADDVQCSHGNTAGQLDEQAVFYLRSRGLPEAEARAMITRAFLIAAIPEWVEEALRSEIEARIDAWLRGEA
jgi:Fe-S cluster assembly protein SufD